MNLPNNCSCTEPTVSPKNWNKKDADPNVKWRIHYQFTNSDGRTKQVAIRFNKSAKKRGFENDKAAFLADKREDARMLLAKERANLLKGYNPFKVTPDFLKTSTVDIDPSMPFVIALQAAADRIKCGKHTRECIKSALNILGRTAAELHYHTMPVHSISRKHIKLIMERCQKKNDLTPGNYNHYRAYLIMVYNHLVEMEAVDSNPVYNIAKQDEVMKIREILSDEHTAVVMDYLFQRFYTFWRYTHIFFHVGGRTTELFKLQVKDVNMEMQYFKLTVLKGKKKKEVLKVIKDVALPFWREQLEGAKPNDYVFSKFLKPGPKPITAIQITKRWYKYVKKPLWVLDGEPFKVTADFYAFKHKAAEAMREELSLQEVSEQLSHSSTSTTKIYTVKEFLREREKIKKSKVEL